MSPLYAAVLGVIIVTLLVVSLLRARTVKTKADFLVAGRSLPAFVLVFTLLSSWIGSGSLLAGAENAYRHGFVALWQGGGGWAGLLLIYFIAPRARRFAQFTIPDLLEARYSQLARVLGVIAVLFAYTAITSYQFIGGGDILHLIFPTVISATAGKILLAVFVTLLTAIAGMSSVAYMDVVIGLLATVSMLVAFPVLVHAAGGWDAVRHTLPATHFQVLGDYTLLKALELFLPTCLLMLGNQSMYQKFFSAKSEKDARVAVVGWIVGTVILETVIVALAVVGSALFKGGEVANHPREILAYSALHGMPGILGAVLMGAIFAKVISTANNYLFSPATNLIEDVFARYIAPGASNKTILIVSRLMVVLLGAWALWQAMGTESVLAKALYAYTVYSAALTPVILAAFYWKRANAAGAVSAIAAGTFVTVFWNTAFVHSYLPAAIAERDAIFPALIAAVFCLFAVSLATKPPRPEQIALTAEEHV
ncbi:sodium:solute symporter family protein [Silvibacterium dinghuense]|uniref:Sodium:solute symporter family protein n=1 Tax=Silvibacterium dinghuense TaxID=1560006 RepID=A0A4V1NUW9_9BACT|nr:sodium:solute symporter family protein [Silvibacterium dinghuense]RXS93714.1 sodium:solute symporter family protein [Silvibacterium dinghuense]GGH07074.1 3-guanidinopropionate transporter [Silvibacterium dinghuense]